MPLNSTGKVDLEALEKIVNMMKTQQISAVSPEELANMMDSKATIGDKNETNSSSSSSSHEEAQSQAETPFAFPASNAAAATPGAAPLFADVSNIKFTVGTSSPGNKKHGKPTAKTVPSPAAANLSASLGKLDLSEGAAGAGAGVLPPAPPPFDFAASVAAAAASSDAAVSASSVSSGSSAPASSTPKSGSAKFAPMPQTSSAENTDYFTFSGKENVQFSAGVPETGSTGSGRAGAPRRRGSPGAGSTTTPDKKFVSVPPIPPAAPHFANFVFDKHLNSGSAEPKVDSTGTGTGTSAGAPRGVDSDDDSEEEAEWRGEEEEDEDEDEEDEDDSEDGIVINKRNIAQWKKEYADAAEARRLDEEAARALFEAEFCGQQEDGEEEEEGIEEGWRDPASEAESEEDSNSDSEDEESDSEDSRYAKEDVEEEEEEEQDPRYFQARTGRPLRVDPPTMRHGDSDRDALGSPMDIASPVSEASAERERNVWTEGAGGSPVAKVMPPPPPVVFVSCALPTATAPSATAAAGPVGVDSMFKDPSNDTPAPFSMPDAAAAGATGTFSMGTAGPGSGKKKATKAKPTPPPAAAAVSPNKANASSRYYNPRTNQYYEISDDSDEDEEEDEEDEDLGRSRNVNSLKKPAHAGASVDADLRKKMSGLWTADTLTGTEIPMEPVPPGPTVFPEPPLPNPRTSAASKPQYGASIGARMQSNAADPTPTPPPPPPAANAFPPAPPAPAKDATSKMQPSMALVADTHRKQGKEHYEKELYDKALLSFTKAMQVAPADWFYKATVLGNRAAALMMLDRYVEAAEDCQQAVRLDPTLVRLHSRRGRALCKLGQLEAATESYTRVLESCSTSTVNNVKAHATSGTTLSQAAAAAAKAEESTSNREDAKAGLKQLALARDLLVFLNRADQKDTSWTHKGGATSSSTATTTPKEMMRKIDELLSICPQMRQAQAFKTKGLVKQGCYVEAKEYVEETIRSSHQSVLALHAHPAASYPVPARALLRWNCYPKNAIKITVDSKALTNFFLIIGSGSGSMAVWYINALKNQDLCRAHSTEVINVLSGVLDALLSTCTTSGRPGGGGRAAGHATIVEWVTNENDKSSALISLKTQADKLFRGGSYAAAIKLYSELLLVDPEAVRWSAVIYSNRAAAHMSLNSYTEAVNDCNKAIALDDEYARAYLRRARAHKAQHHYAASIRDFRRYLSSDPVPADASAVQKEMEETGVARDKYTNKQQADAAAKARKAGGTGAGTGGSDGRPSYWDHYSKTKPDMGMDVDSDESDDVVRPRKGKGAPSNASQSKPKMNKYDCKYNPATGRYESRPRAEQEDSSSSESDVEDRHQSNQSRYNAFRSEFYDNINKSKANQPPPPPAGGTFNTAPNKPPSAGGRKGDVRYDPKTNSYRYVDEPAGGAKPTPTPQAKPKPKPTSNSSNYNSGSAYSNYQKTRSDYNRQSSSYFNAEDDYHSGSGSGSGSGYGYSNPYGGAKTGAGAGYGGATGGYGSRSSSQQSGGSSSSNRSSSKSSGSGGKERDHYTVLGVHPTRSTEAEIKKAYRKLALKYHPDKNKDPAAVSVFQEVTNAYSVLSDKTTRRKYDISRPL